MTDQFSIKFSLLVFKAIYGKEIALETGHREGTFWVELDRSKLDKQPLIRVARVLPTLPWA